VCTRPGRISLLILYISCLLFPLYAYGQSQLYNVTNSTIYFHSNAPQGLIEASTDKLAGVLDISKRAFSFKIYVPSFVGFNNALQREHFNENYMESVIYPYAYYSGKIIEEIDLSKDGDFNVRTKGKLSIHGVEHQCIIKCHIVCKKGVIYVKSNFVVLLADYDIKIPRIVCDKIAPEINVSVDAMLVPKPLS